MDKIELPPGWKVVKLGEICIKTKTRNPSKKPDEIFTYIDVSSICNNSFRITETKNILGKDAPSRARQIIYKNDVIFATVRPTLKRVALIPSELDDQICSTGFCVLRSNPEYLDSSYLYFYLLTNNINRRVESLQKGATYPAINNSDLFEQEIPLPPLPEQKSIAHTLRTIQKAKETRQRELELERERKAALMEYLFTHGTRNEARKQTEIGEIPESWEVVKLGKIACIDMGQSPSGDTYNNTGVGKPLLNGPAEFGLEYPTPVQWTNKPTKICQIGDILFCVRGNTTGKMNIADQEYCIGRGIAAIRGEKSYSNTLFIKYLLQYNISQIYRIALSGGSTFPNIGSRQLKDYPVMYINQAEQKEIADILKSCDTKIQALEKEISLTDELFHATLEELMTGKLSTKNLIAQ